MIPPSEFIDHLDVSGDLLHGGRIEHPASVRLAKPAHCKFRCGTLCFLIVKNDAISHMAGEYKTGMIFDLVMEEVSNPPPPGRL